MPLQTSAKSQNPDASQQATAGSSFDAGDGQLAPSNIGPLEQIRNGTDTLHRGSHGSAVKELQSIIKTITQSEFDVDGAFGGKTVTAIKQIQIVTGLVKPEENPTGVVDAATLQMLEKLELQYKKTQVPPLHVMALGESLSSIANEFWQKPKWYGDLAKRNSMIDTAKLQAGDIILLGPKPEHERDQVTSIKQSDKELAEFLSKNFSKIDFSKLYAPVGDAYATTKPHSHYEEPIITTDRLHGNSRVVGDADQHTQAAVIYLASAYLLKNSFSPKQIAFALATMRVESGFNPDAASNESAAGVMQFIDSKRSSLCERAELPDRGPFSISTSMHCGVIQLRDSFAYASKFTTPDKPDFYAYAYCYHHDGAHDQPNPSILALAHRQILPLLPVAEAKVEEVKNEIAAKK